MVVTYIYHSGYAIEFDDFSILIDFHSDVKRDEKTYWVKDYLLGKQNDLYVLCTHSHPDHFNPEILLWKKEKPNIHYIFSKELLLSQKALPEDAYYLDKGDVYEDKHIRIEAFGSTDVGNSFLFTHNDIRFFHAGDLNNWHWSEEVSKKEALTCENNFLCELELIAERTDHIHVAMFPIDPRLGRKYMRGAEQFVKRIKTDYFLPMHFGECYDKANAFKPYASKHGCAYLAVTRPGQSFCLY